jgi:hypothetical protein
MRRAAAIAILTCLPLSAVLGDVYRSVDAQGHVLYSDTPTPGAELVRITSGQSRNFMAPVRASVSTRTTSDTKSGDPIREQLAREDAARNVQNDTTQTRADQCKKAQDAYQSVIVARRIYSEDKNGERQYLSDDEAEKARVNAKLTMDQACKS